MYLHLRGNPTLEALGQISLILQTQIQGYKSLDPPKKHQKSIQTKLVFHIYKKHYSHLSTAIGKLIVGAFFFGIRSCEYSTKPKQENKQTRILQKGDIRLYRKQRELLYSRDCIHLEYKVSLTFRTQKNGVKNSIVTQWRTGKNRCPLVYQIAITLVGSHNLLVTDGIWALD